ncbi:hypothetical protein [Peribacillus kribbensis]|uniref:hypothetical protein n=1 Tax=Peribacillus kribbensis TaxID=356658 RepID=UPI0004195845|nr:hypothetical protein [Peribacillus kribbensis]
MRKEKRPVSYQQTLGTKIERAEQLPEGYDISAFDPGTAENPTRKNEPSQES